MEIGKCFTHFTPCFPACPGSIHTLATGAWNLVSKIASVIIDPFGSLRSLFELLCPCCFKSKTVTALKLSPLKKLRDPQELEGLGSLGARLPPLHAAAAVSHAVSSRVLQGQALGPEQPLDQVIAGLVKIALAGHKAQKGKPGWLQAARSAHEEAKKFKDDLSEDTRARHHDLSGSEEMGRKIDAEITKLNALSQRPGYKDQYNQMVASLD